MKECVELDAEIVLAGMTDGMDGIMNFAFTKKHIFTTTKVF